MSFLNFFRGGSRVWPQMINFSPVSQGGAFLYFVTKGLARREGEGRRQPDGAQGFDTTAIWNAKSTITWNPELTDLRIVDRDGELQIVIEPTVKRKLVIK